MALVACKECGKEISKKAEACPNCGFKPKRTSAITWLVTIFVVGLVAISTSQQAQSPEQVAAKRQRQLEQDAAERKRELEQDAADRKKELDRGRELYARIIAEREISKQLKAPSTADFSGLSETQVLDLKDSKPNVWVVRGYVDAQNGFGAMIRRNYQVVIEFEVGKHDSYRVTNAIFLTRE